ncbi:hypothetical protein HK28_07285 [Acetobacter sp. DsW_063]|nr:hypothetical protein HK28_07285 [Acetobacter sp. DsW_063]
MADRTHGSVMGGNHCACRKAPSQHEVVFLRMNVRSARARRGVSVCDADGQPQNGANCEDRDRPRRIMERGYYPPARRSVERWSGPEGQA